MKSFSGSFVPAIGICRIVVCLGGGSQLQRVEGIYHHRQFIGAVDSEALLDSTGMWPMRNTTWVQGE